MNRKKSSVLKRSTAIVTAATVGIAGVFGLIPQNNLTSAHASSHSDAPLIKLDPQANLTDVYTFISNGFNPQTGTTVKMLNILVNVHPFIEPGDGITYDKFADDALYSLHIANPNTGAILRTYNFQFSPVNSGYKNLDTILTYGRGANIGNNPDAGPIMNVGDAHQNYVQTYTVTRVDANGNSTLITPSPLMVPPPNVGLRTTPLYNFNDGTQTTLQTLSSDHGSNGRPVSGAATYNALDTYTKQTVYGMTTGEVLFAGTRDDSFFADTPAIFDFLDPRILTPSPNGTFGQTPPNTTSANANPNAGYPNFKIGVDGFKGFNVLTYAIQIPLSDLNAASLPVSYGDPFAGTTTGVGVFASVSRPRITLRSASGANTSSGPYIMVNREANPLFNEVLVAIRDKDRYNRTLPVNDNDPNVGFAKYALAPELPALINIIYGTNFATTGRVDLKAVYIPDVIKVSTVSDVTTLAGAGTGFNRFGFIGGDVINAPTSGGLIPAGKISAGWPNGRRFGDDVLDIALTAIASGPSYSTVTLVGDNIATNDQPYNLVFPYSATPNAGARNTKDSGSNVGF